MDQTVTPNRTINYYYAGDFVYRSGATGSPDTLEFISHPEGRLRPVRIDTTQAISIANLKYIYDYYLKDHLGSVRSVLTTEQETDLYAATMETAAASKENALFNNVSTTAVAKPSGFDTNGSNAQVSQLNGNVNITTNHRVGPSIILKVMAGDTVSISTYGWYTGSVQPPATGVGPIVNDLLPLLTNGILANGGSKGGSVPSATYSPLITAALDSFLQYNQPYNNTRPKAYLNWVVVDEEFKKVSSPNHAGAVQIPLITGSMQAQAMIGPANMVVRRNGYLYVYLSNESNQNVDFDNLVISQKRGPLVEQKDYYAFGLEIPGLSTQAFKPKYDQNRYKFNGIEYDTAFGFDQYEAKYRDYDPQIGRFIQVDPKVESAEGWSVYSAMLDNPIRFTDPLGDSTIPGAGFWANAWEGAKDGAKETIGFVKSLGTIEGWQNVGNGISDLADRASPISPTGMAKNAQTGAAIVEGIKNLPNMTKDQLGHALGFGAEKVIEAAALSKGIGLAKDAVAASTSTTLFRAASDAEVGSVAENGLQTKAGTFETSKLFATSASDAAQFGKNNFYLDGQPNTILKVNVSKASMKTATTFEADGMKAVALPSEQLQNVNWVRPLNSTSKPSNPFGMPGW